MQICASTKTVILLPSSSLLPDFSFPDILFYDSYDLLIKAQELLLMPPNSYYFARESHWASTKMCWQYITGKVSIYLGQFIKCQDSGCLDRRHMALDCPHHTSRQNLPEKPFTLFVCTKTCFLSIFLSQYQRLPPALTNYNFL